MILGSLYTRVKNKGKSYFFLKKIKKKKEKNLNIKNKSLIFNFFFKKLMLKYKSKVKNQGYISERSISEKIKINNLKNFSMEIFFLLKKKKKIKDFLSIIIFRKNKLNIEFLKLKKISNIFLKQFLLNVGSLFKLTVYNYINLFKLNIYNYIYFKSINNKDILINIIEGFLFLKESRVIRYKKKKKIILKEYFLEIFVLLFFNQKVSKVIEKNIKFFVKKRNDKFNYYFSFFKKNQYSLSFFLDVLDFLEDLEINYKLYNLMFFDFKKLIKGEIFIDSLILRKLFKIYTKIKKKGNFLNKKNTITQKSLKYFINSNPILKGDSLKFGLLKKKNNNKFKSILKISNKSKEGYKKKIIKNILINKQNDIKKNYKLYLYNKFKNELIQNFSIYLFDIFNLYNKIQDLQISNKLLFYKNNNFKYLNYFKKDYLSTGNILEIFLEKYIISSDLLSIFFDDVSGKEIKEERKKEEKIKEEREKEEKIKEEEEKEEKIKEEEEKEEKIKEEEEKEEKLLFEELDKEEKRLDAELKKEKEEVIETSNEIILKLKLKQIKNKLENTFKSIYLNNQESKYIIDNLNINQKFINELLYVLGLKKGFFNFFEIFLTKSINKALVLNSFIYIFNFYNINLINLRKNISNFNNFKLFNYFLNNIFRLSLVKILKLELKKEKFNNLSLNMSKFFLIKLDNFLDKDFINREINRLNIKVIDKNERLLDMGTRRRKFQKIRERFKRIKKSSSEYVYVPNPEIEKYKQKWFKEKRKKLAKQMGKTEDEWLKEEEILEEKLKKEKEEKNKKLEKNEKKKIIKQKEQLLKKIKLSKERKKRKIELQVYDRIKIHEFKGFPKYLSNNLNTKINKYFKDSFYFFENINFKFFIYFTFEYLKNNKYYFFSQNLDLKHFIFFSYYDNLRNFNLKKKIFKYKKRPRIRKVNQNFDYRFKNKYFISTKFKKIIKHKIFSKSDIKKLKNINKIFGFLIKNSKYNVTNKFQFFDLFVKNKQIINRIKYFFKFKKIKIKINGLHLSQNLNDDDLLLKYKRVRFFRLKKQRIPDSLIILDSYSNISSIIVECDLFNIPIIKFINPEEFNLNFDYPIPVYMNNKNQIFFLNFFLRVTFIGYKKFLYKLNSLKSNYNKSKKYLKDLKNVY